MHQYQIALLMGKVTPGHNIWTSGHTDYRIYVWDKCNDEIEVFNKLGMHLGVIDPHQSLMTKDAVKGRKIDVSADSSLKNIKDAVTIRNHDVFIDKYLQNEVTFEDIDDFVVSWHEDVSVEPLHLFLGMKRSEYSLWVVDPDVLPYILYAHEDGVDLSVFLDKIEKRPQNERSHHRAMNLMHWLKSKGTW